MIKLTRMGGKDLLVNEDWLEVVEENPDTTLIFANGTKLIVKENLTELLTKIRAWQAGAATAVRRPRRNARR